MRWVLGMADHMVRQSINGCGAECSYEIPRRMSLILASWAKVSKQTA